MDSLQKFQDLLKRLFQFEASDLDFGSYRILNYKRDRIEKFIQEDLKNKVESAFAKHREERLTDINQRFESVKEKIIQTFGIEFKPTKGGKSMREILSDKGSVREWYNRARFVYTTKIGRISELSSDMNKLGEVGLSKTIDY